MTGVRMSRHCVFHAPVSIFSRCEYGYDIVHFKPVTDDTYRNTCLPEFYCERSARTIAPTEISAAPSKATGDMTTP